MNRQWWTSKRYLDSYGNRLWQLQEYNTVLILLWDFPRKTKLWDSDHETWDHKICIIPSPSERTASFFLVNLISKHNFHLRDGMWWVNLHKSFKILKAWFPSRFPLRKPSLYSFCHSMFLFYVRDSQSFSTLAENILLLFFMNGLS